MMRQRCEEVATVKRPKKHFKTENEREKFVKQYQMKFKTEMCRNWELSGSCFFKDTCSFAHGEHELMKKQHLPSNFKSKLCIQFHQTGFCPYGSRCQFLHSQFDVLLTNSDRITYQMVLSDNIRLSHERLHQMKDSDFLHDESLIYVDVFQTRNKRLSVFQGLMEDHGQSNSDKCRSHPYVQGNKRKEGHSKNSYY